MKQVFIIHGGDAYPTHAAYLESLHALELDYQRLKPKQRWKQWIADQLPDVDILTPSMPNSSNAQYDEWKIMFEKLVSFFGDDVTLAGHSLGGIFLLKYLHENTLPTPIRNLILIASPLNNEDRESLGEFKLDTIDLSHNTIGHIHLFHSTDDPVVPYSEAEKIHAQLPHATLHTFEDRLHFNQSTFPELVDILT